MKKNFDVLRDYVRKLVDEDLKFIGTRLSQRVGGDIAEVVEFLQKCPEVNHWLASATSANDFFDMVDHVDGCVQQESKKRFLVHEKAKV